MKHLFILLLFIPLWGMAQQEADYVCPPCGQCDSIVYHKPGLCSHCGMTLVLRDTSKIPQPYSICFYLYDGTEVLDFAGPLEVFSYAGFKIFTVGKTKAPVTVQGILKVNPDYSIQDAPPADIFAIFGGDDGVAANDPEVINWIKSRDASTKVYFSVCTGAFVLGNAGLLDNLTVTTFHNSIKSLQKVVPSAKVLANVRYVDNGRIITTAGISAGIDGALHLVAKLKGEAEALRIAKHMEYDKYVPEQGLIVKH
ncbi:AraC family transcriptional regulator, transcriptional activator FtrA [Chitinophaga sp. CF118]|uniref:DJ-1/PfpI family protein n=1 Tax=Chitinophaga sp. CF118 TaxID=1884367 RepID=UPI0008EFB9C6|nr:DJ-1/PfpI family protein [Chitinophaga sp. CF118]SFE61034.1 AraC family transcriptional regulator, transcriptional activator FtrA [Chitinophaga sp. CF118]